MRRRGMAAILGAAALGAGLMPAAPAAAAPATLAPRQPASQETMCGIRPDSASLRTEPGRDTIRVRGTYRCNRTRREVRVTVTLRRRTSDGELRPVARFINSRDAADSVKKTGRVECRPGTYKLYIVGVTVTRDGAKVDRARARTGFARVRPINCGPEPESLSR